MKKILLACLAIAAIASSNNMFAQTVQTGAVVTYSTTGSVNTSSYNWSVSGGAGTSTSNTINVTWGAPGSGSLSVYAISDHSCNGATQTLNVTIVNTLPVTFSMGAMSPICPVTTNQPAGGDPAFTATITGATAGQSVSVSYSVDGGATWTTANGTALTAGLTSNFALDANLDGSVGSVTVTIKNWTVNGVTYTPATALTGAVTVYPAPTVSAPIAQ